MLVVNDIGDPYFRDDPGIGIQRIPVYKFDLDNDFSVWKSWRTNDGRVLPNRDSSFDLIDNPFEYGSVIRLNTHFDPAVAGKSFGGYGIRAPINPAVTVNNQTFIELDFYYPASAVGKYMRLEIWSTTSGGEGSQVRAGFPGVNRTQLYIRAADLARTGGFGENMIGSHNGEIWYRIFLYAVSPVSSGTWEYLNIDLHTETGTKVEGGLLMLGNIRITQADPKGIPIPNIVNTKKFDEVEPIKNKYNPRSGYFLMGVAINGIVSPAMIKSHHYELFVDQNNLKPDCHVLPPEWLRKEFPGFVFKPAEEGPEWNIPTSHFQETRDLSKKLPDGTYEYKMHGHCLAWSNQSPQWLRQIVPENITSMQWNEDGMYYMGGNNATGPYKKVNKNIARRVNFNHILYILRHFMTTDARYDSSVERGIIPFHSFDVINVEIHESRHYSIIKENPGKWDTALRHVSWLMAMTDNDLGDMRQHYIYLLFKFAHIAVPNAQMAAKYKENYNDSLIVPDYMKMDNHDKNGSIDDYITKIPPLLILNDYEFTSFSKTKAACNMIRELNELWKTDPLYDGRNLIECLGIQGHEWISPTRISQNQRAVAMFAGLIDEGSLDKICYSEVDFRLPDHAPGGQALAPDILNLKQADALGYQYALFFKMLDKYKKYIDHVIFWGEYGMGYLSSYLPFDQDQMASQGYYGIMEPDKFIQGHTYLTEYFEDEYERVQPGYVPELK